MTQSMAEDAHILMTDYQCEASANNLKKIATEGNSKYERKITFYCDPQEEFKEDHMVVTDSNSFSSANP